MNAKGWTVIEFNGVTRVIPVEERHVMSASCPCGPFDEEGVLVHNSYDGREITERAVAAIPDSKK